jgi:hypothetical protein
VPLTFTSSVALTPSLVLEKIASINCRMSPEISSSLHVMKHARHSALVACIYPQENVSW